VSEGARSPEGLAFERFRVGDREEWLMRLGRPVDPTIVTLHVAAIARAARAEDDSVRAGQAVAAELAALVAKRLSENEPG